MKIGIPKERKCAENRIALTPTDVKSLAKENNVYIETEAGLGAGYSDAQYLKAGAKIVTQEALYQKSELIVKVKEPVEEDLAYLNASHTLFCYLHLAGSKTLTEALLEKKLTAYAFETVKKEGKTPLLAPMSAIAGRLSVQIGAKLLHKVSKGAGVLLGGFSNHPAGCVTIIGAGIAGTEAAIASIALGAEVHLLDINEDRLNELKAKFPKLNTAISSSESLEKLLPKTDLLIGSVYVVGKAAPHVVSNEQLKLMKKGRAAVDISIDQGGCFEFSEPCTHKDTYKIKQDILVSAITNLPGTVPLTASEALSSAILPYVKELAENKISPSLNKGLSIQNGELKTTL